MLTYELDTKSSQSLYEQLYRAIRSDIEAGFLQAHSKLPSKRILAQHLGISVITVENAYRQLMAEGYVETEQRRGYFVNELPSVPNSAPTQESAQEWQTGSEQEQKAASGERLNPPFTQTPSSSTSIQATPLLADFTGAHQAANLFPFHIWAKTVRQTLNEASKGSLLRTSHDNCGAEELRCAISQHLMSFRGLSVSPEQIIIGAGAQDLYGVLVQLLGRDRIFAVENPGYSALRTHYELAGATVQCVPVDKDGIDVAKLRNCAASVAHCTPAHQFPTGSVMSAVRRRELLDWTNQNGEGPKRYIIEDDYDSEFRMRGRPIPPLRSSDTHESVIYLNTFTRSLGSVFRIAYMVLPPHLLPVFKSRFAERSCMVGALEQLELARFITSGNYERHVNRQRTAYRRLQERLVAQLSKSLAGPHLSFRGVGDGLHFLMTIKTDTPSPVIEAAALEQGIRLVNVRDYYVGRAPQTADVNESPVHMTQKSTEKTLGVQTPSQTYVMNVSGLDGQHTDEIATALCNATLSIL